MYEIGEFSNFMQQFSCFFMGPVRGGEEFTGAGGEGGMKKHGYGIFHGGLDWPLSKGRARFIPEAYSFTAHWPKFGGAGGMGLALWKRSKPRWLTAAVARTLSGRPASFALEPIIDGPEKSSFGFFYESIIMMFPKKSAVERGPQCRRPCGGIHFCSHRVFWSFGSRVPRLFGAGLRGLRGRSFVSRAGRGA